MAEAVLTLRLNPETGEKTLVISYESEPDMMAFEHEDEHRAFIERLLGHPVEHLADQIEVKRASPHPLIQQAHSAESERLETKVAETNES